MVIAITQFEFQKIDKRKGGGGGGGGGKNFSHVISALFRTNFEVLAEQNLS